MYGYSRLVNVRCNRTKVSNAYDP